MPTKLDLHILDSASQVNQTNMSDCNIIYWESYLGSEQDGVFSISHLVEQNASNLKASYLKLIYDFGEAKINDKRVIVEGLNMVKKTTKPNPSKGEQGGIISKEMPLDISNIAIFFIQSHVTVAI